MSKHPKSRPSHGFGKGPDGKITKLGEAPKAPAPGQRRAMTEKETLAARLVAVRAALIRKNSAIRELTLENARMAQQLAEARSELLTAASQNEEAENNSMAKRFGLPAEFRFYEEEADGRKTWYVENMGKGEPAPPTQVGKKRPAPAPEPEPDDDLDDSSDEVTEPDESDEETEADEESEADEADEAEAPAKASSTK